MNNRRDRKNWIEAAAAPSAAAALAFPADAAILAVWGARFRWGELSQEGRFIDFTAANTRMLTQF
jgi:hypothetical protein